MKFFVEVGAEFIVLFHNFPKQAVVNQCVVFFTDGCSCFPGWKGENCSEGVYK